MTQFRATYLQKRALHELLDKHCVKDAEGYARYAEGWDDDRIHKEYKNPEPQNPISKVAVSNFRLDVFGKVKRPNGAGPSKYDTLTAELVKMREDYGRLKGQLASIIEYLVRTKGYQPPIGRPQSTPPDR